MHVPYSRGHDVEMTEESALILYFIRKYVFLRKMYGLGTNVIFFCASSLSRFNMSIYFRLRIICNRSNCINNTSQANLKLFQIKLDL